MLTGITLFRLIAAALLPVLVTVGFYQAEKKSRFGKIPDFWKQLVIGLFFGIVAILATEFGQTRTEMYTLRSLFPQRILFLRRTQASAIP